MKSFEEIAGIWLQSELFGKQYSYRKGLEKDVEHLIEYFGSRNCEEIKGMDVDKFIQYETEHVNPNTGKPFSKRLMKAHLSAGLNIYEAILSVINSDRYVSGDFDFEDYKGEFEDKSIPFFGNTNDINAILLSMPHLKATKEEIAAYFVAEHDEQKRVDYIKSIFNHDFTEVIIPDGRRMGYKAYRSVLHLWTGGYGDHTSQSFYQWRTIAAHFEGMRLLGELHDTAKPQANHEGQLELVPGFSGDEKPSFVFTQEIIDAVLTRGSGVSQSKMRIYRQFQTPSTQSERISFLKNEYGWGGSYPVITGTGIDENHDGKGIHLQRGFADDAPKLLLKWSQVEQRIGELIRADQYLSPTQKALYPEWLEREEARESGVRIDVEGLPPVIEPEPIEPKEPVTETPESVTTVRLCGAVDFCRFGSYPNQRNEPV